MLQPTAGSMGFLPLLFLLFLIDTTTVSQDTDSTVLFDDCDEAVYYQELSSVSPDRLALESLLQRTHWRQLPYTDNDDDDVWKALLDVDQGDDEPDTVRLIYKAVLQYNAEATRAEASNGWNREHLWPKSRGVGESGPAFVDVHHLVPADWNVNSARSNKWLGTCPATSTTSADSCTRPAHPEAAMDTSASSSTFLPPASSRGQIARALFYMDVRYSAANHPVDLELTDCTETDSDDEGRLGYLSQLLEWHAMYPVTDFERRRNQRVCERWQGNRNPFVDHPEWVEPLYRNISDILEYPCSDTPDNNGDNNNSTTTTNTTCPSPGSVMFVGINTDNPDAVALVALANLTSGARLYLTDNDWDPTTNEFRSNEGTLQYTIPLTGLSAGTVFGPGLSFSSSTWESAGGSFALSASGEALLLYCLEEDSSDDDIQHVAGLSLVGPWNEGTSTQDDDDSHFLPATLTAAKAAVALDHVDNARYVGPMVGTPSYLRTEIVKSTNWRSSNSDRVDLEDGWRFRVRSSASTHCRLGLYMLLYGSVLVSFSLGVGFF